jgi:ABC-type antimicrobial peptide transport system permease subunit
MALGAEPASIVRLLLSRVAALVVTGLIGGAVISLWASRLVVTLLYDIQPGDPATLIGALLVLSGVATLAAGVPAWRASRIDPAMTLRCN